MVVLAKQAYKHIGKYCTRLTERKGVYKAYFRIPKDQKEDISSIISLGATVDISKNSVTGYIEIANYPSVIFGKKVMRINDDEKEPELSSMKESVADAASIPDISVETEVVEESKKEAPKVTPLQTRKEVKLPDKKEVNKEEQKKKKRGFFFKSKDKDND